MNNEHSPLRATSLLISIPENNKLEARSLQYIAAWLGISLFSNLIALVLFIAIRQKYFLFYVLFNLGPGLYIGSHIGDIKYFLDADPYNYRDVFSYTGTACVILFLPLFLNSLTPLSQRNPIMWRIASVFVGIALVILCVNLHTGLRMSVFGHFTHLYLTYTTGIVLLGLLVMLVPCMIRNDKNAKLIFAIYGLYILAVFINILLPGLGLAEGSHFVYSAVLIGSPMEIFAFMYLMGYETFVFNKERSELLQKQKQFQKEIIISITKAQESERNRIGRELHDMVGSNLAMIKQQMETKTKVEASLIGDTIENIRDLSHGLVTPLVAGNDFQHEIRQLCDQVSTDSMKVSCYFHEWPEMNNEQIAHHLYGICQELLANAVKHSKAPDTYIQFLSDINEGMLTIIYEDNGIGFETTTRAGHGIGLRNVGNRIYMMKGHLEIDSSPGHGTSVLIEIAKELAFD